MSNRPSRRRPTRNPIRENGIELARWTFDDEGDRAHAITVRAYFSTQIDRLVLLDGQCMLEPLVFTAATARIIAGALLAGADLIDGHTIAGGNP